MKGYWTLLFLGLLSAACHQAKTIKLRPVVRDSARNSGFILNKIYTDAELTDGLENGFVKTLLVRPKDENTYFVLFSSSPNPDNQAKNCCKYKGWGTVRNDSIFVEMVNYEKPIMLVITHGLAESVQPELIVNTVNEKDRDRLKDFCCGGKTLAGKYILRTPLSSDE